MIFHILRHWIAFFVAAFYPLVRVKNIQHALRKGPVIIAMNHPNAFTDPILFQILALPVRLNFLARGDAFKPGLVSYLLESIGIVPIFRIQDAGKEGLKKNDETYQRVNALLSRNQKVIVFAEGLCIQERRLRPLKKGVARMVFGAYESLQNTQLTVVPVCVNYSKAHQFRSKVFYNVGEPIFVRDFYDEYLKNPARANKTFLQTLEPAMRKLLTHIEDPANDRFVEQVEIMVKRGRMRQRHLDPRNLEHDFSVLSELTEEINQASKQNPELCRSLRTETNLYIEELRKHGFRDWLFDPARKVKKDRVTLGLRLLLVFCGLPLFALALIGNYLPFRLTDVLTRRFVSVKEFYSSVAIGIAMALFLVNYTAWYIVLRLCLPAHFWVPPFLLLLGLCAWFSLHYVPFARKTFGILNLYKRPASAARLREKRGQILADLNIFCTVQMQSSAH